MITDEQRVQLGGLALTALDTIEADYGDDAELADAILVYEVTFPDGSSEGNWHSTNTRSSVNVGLLRLSIAAMEAPERSDDA